ncbi:MAG: queuosine precursor transporter [Paludibacter sp.]
MSKKVSIVYMICSLMFTVCLIVANIVSQKIVRVFGFDITAGLLIFPLTYIINDLVAEVWGYRKMRMIIWIGFMLNFFAVFIFRISFWLPSSPHFIYQHAFAQILLSSERIAIASFIAFLIGSFINAYIMSKMKVRQHGRHFGIRAIVSTIFGEGADSLVFFTIAFSGIIKHHHLIIMIFTQIILKTAYELILLPVTIFIVKWIKNHEHTEVIDYGISYNPFKVKDI